MIRSTDIVEWLRQRLQAAGSHGLVVGLSGGVDSAVVARLCQIASPGKVVGVIMPCHSDPRDEADARLLATHFDIPAIRVDLAMTCADPSAAVRWRPGKWPAVVTQLVTHLVPEGRIPTTA